VRQPLTAPPRSTAPRPKAPRPKATRSKPRVTGYRYVATALNVRTAPSAAAKALTVLARGTRIGVTGNTDGKWVQVVNDGTVAWVNGRYLSESKPAKPAQEPAQEPTQQPQQTKKVDGISFAPCPSGSGVENGLMPDAVRVHRAVCARFPDVSSYGGLRGGGGEHSEGRALDIMVARSSLGDAIASWVRANYRRLGVSEVIWEQRIWTVQRASEGWRLMADRGSVTANHYDHVHVTVYGDAGS
jgi:SH3 domain-containing protein